MPDLETIRAAAQARVGDRGPSCAKRELGLSSPLVFPSLLTAVVLIDGGPQDKSALRSRGQHQTPAERGIR